MLRLKRDTKQSLNYMYLNDVFDDIVVVVFFQIRWVVESANARIKRWKYLDRVLPNSQVPYIGDYLRIICAVCNKYLPALSKSSESDEIEAQHMLQLASNSNSLQQQIISRGLEKSRAVWKTVTETELDDFPRLTEEQLRTITCGIYQLKLSPGYIQEHLKGDADMFVHKDDKGLIRVRLQSRHISAKQYTLWIRYSSSEITGWYCKCRAGARVVGMCAHCAAVIWYLAYARQRFVNIPGVKDWSHFLEDAAEEIPAAIDMSESECDSD